MDNNVDQTNNESDLTTIVLTSDGRTIIEKLHKEKEWFETMSDAAHFSLALAMNRKENLECGELEQGKTTWAVDRFDKEGKLQTIVIALYPECSSTPIRQINYLIDIGTQLINDFLDNDPSATLTDLLEWAKK